MRPAVPADLEAIELVRVRLPLVEPFVASHGVEHERDLTLVHAIGTDGAEGWGECDALSSATYSSEDGESAWRFLRDGGAAKALAGEQLDIGGFPMAWTAIEVAFLDLALRREHLSLAAHVGATRASVACAAVIGRQASIDALLEVVDRRVGEGAVLIKLKIAPGWDREPLQAVRAAFAAVPLAADANGAYGRADHAWLRSLDSLELTYVEQPVSRDDLDHLNELSDELATPVAADESVTDLAVLDRLRASVIINVKPARLGGVGEAQLVIERCGATGTGCFIGGMLEAGIGRAVALTLAGIGSLTLPTDLGPSSRYVADDITDPFVLRDDGTLAVPAGPGIGVVPRADRLDAVTVERVMIRR